jgi:hypothetical protein
VGRTRKIDYKVKEDTNENLQMKKKYSKKNLNIRKNDETKKRIKSKIQR